MYQSKIFVFMCFLQDLISRITDTRDDVRMMLDMAGDLLRDGQVFVDNATANYRVRH